MSFLLPQKKYEPSNPHPKATHALLGKAPRLQVINIEDEFAGVLESFCVHPLKRTHVPASALSNKVLSDWIARGYIELEAL